MFCKKPTLRVLTSLFWSGVEPDLDVLNWGSTSSHSDGEVVSQNTFFVKPSANLKNIIENNDQASDWAALHTKTHGVPHSPPRWRPINLLILNTIVAKIAFQVSLDDIAFFNSLNTN